MGLGEREGGQADGDVFGALGTRGAVATHSPREARTAWPAFTSISPPSNSTRIEPRSTTVNSSKPGRCPGSDQPEGLRMWAMLTGVVSELTRPMYSSIFLLPGTGMRVG